MRNITLESVIMIKRVYLWRVMKGNVMHQNCPRLRYDPQRIGNKTFPLTSIKKTNCKNQSVHKPKRDRKKMPMPAVPTV